MSQHLDRAQNLGYHLWGLMILFLWMQRWNIQAAQPELAAVKADYSL
jgi:asparagine synthase (glutamine-hydrolysing)